MLTPKPNNSALLLERAAGLAVVAVYDDLARRCPGVRPWMQVPDHHRKELLRTVLRFLQRGRSGGGAVPPGAPPAADSGDDPDPALVAILRGPVTEYGLRPAFEPLAAEHVACERQKYRDLPCVCVPDPRDVARNASERFAAARVRGQFPDLDPFAPAADDERRVLFGLVAFAYDLIAFRPVAALAVGRVLRDGTPRVDQPEPDDVADAVTVEFGRHRHRRTPGGEYTHLLPNTDDDLGRNQTLRVLFDFAQRTVRGIRNTERRQNARRAEAVYAGNTPEVKPDRNEPVGDWAERLERVQRALDADEKKLLGLLAVGNRRAQIAAELGVPATTYDGRRRDLFNKLRDLMAPHEVRSAPAAPAGSDPRAELLADTRREKPEYESVVLNMLARGFTVEQIRTALRIGHPGAADPAGGAADAPHVVDASPPERPA